MRIVKSNDGVKVVFDTDNITAIEEYAGRTNELTILRHVHDETDYTFLKKYFPENHSVFSDFGNSFFYVLDKGKSYQPAARGGALAVDESLRLINKDEFANMFLALRKPYGKINLKVYETAI